MRVVLAYAGLLGQIGESMVAYGVLKRAVAVVPDYRLVLALAGAARDIGRAGEAADLLDVLGRQTGSQRVLDTAAALRQEAAEGAR